MRTLRCPSRTRLPRWPQTHRAALLHELRVRSISSRKSKAKRTLSRRRGVPWRAAAAAASHTKDKDGARPGSRYLRLVRWVSQCAQSSKFAGLVSTPEKQDDGAARKSGSRSIAENRRSAHYLWCSRVAICVSGVVRQQESSWIARRLSHRKHILEYRRRHLGSSIVCRSRAFPIGCAGGLVSKTLCRRCQW